MPPSTPHIPFTSERLHFWRSINGASLSEYHHLAATFSELYRQFFPEDKIPVREPSLTEIQHALDAGRMKP